MGQPHHVSSTFEYSVNAIVMMDKPVAKIVSINKNLGTHVSPVVLCDMALMLSSLDHQISAYFEITEKRSKRDKESGDK